ncbi:MAG: response regulator [Chitinivibrionales bacterium]
MDCTILIADNDQNWRDRLSGYFIEREFMVTSVENQDKACAVLKNFHFDIAIIEYCQNGRPADKLCKAIRDKSSTTALILTCKHQTPEAEEKARLHSPAFYFVKPFNIEELYAVVLRVLEIKYRKEQQFSHFAKV